MVAGVVLILAGCQAPSKSSGRSAPSMPPRKNSSARLSSILDSVINKKTYAKDDRAYVESLAKSTEVFDSAMAILVWTAAAQDGLADKAELSDLLLRKTVDGGSATDTTLHAYEFRALVKLGVVRSDRSSASDESKQLTDRSGEGQISTDEKAFVERMFKSKEPADAGEGAILLLTKRGLSSSDAKWALDAIDGRLSTSRGPEMEFLTFAKQVVQQRSPQ